MKSERICSLVVLLFVLAHCGDDAAIVEEETVDACADEPCDNGGQCIDLVDEFVCVCERGFAGPTCSIDIDDCEPNLCFNGGSCVDEVDSFRCDCQPGFWGVQCEHESEALTIETTSLSDALVGLGYSEPLDATGGADRVWSIASGGPAWLSIDAEMGLLSGTPTGTDIGAVSVTVRVEERFYPSNFAEATLAFDVEALPPASYQTGFEGTCPAGWTLTGDWECGVPANVGPAEAFAGTQCLATQIDAPYNNLQTYATAHATSPAISLYHVAGEILSFRMWVDTEGSTYDGFNVLISTDDGVSYSVLSAVSPSYPLTVAAQPAWGGHQGGLGWQLVEADLSAYAGETVRIRFAFQSDSSGVYPGVYIDDVSIAY